MRDRSNVLDELNLKTCSLERADSRLTTLTRTLYENLNGLKTVLHSRLCSNISRSLSSKRSGLSRTSETKSSCGCPRKSVALKVGDGYDGVIERRLNVSRAVLNVLALTASANNLFLSLCHFSKLPLSVDYFFLFAMVFLGPLRVLALVLVR